MKHTILLAAAAVVLTGCMGLPDAEDNSLNCGPPEVAITSVLLTKEGFPIIDDQSAIPVPCVGSGITVTNPPSTPPVDPPLPPVDPPLPPVEPPLPPVEPPVPPVEPPSNKGCNNGHGNLDDCSPGNSGDNDNAENSGNSGDGNSGKGGGGKPFDPPNDN